MRSIAVTLLTLVLAAGTSRFATACDCSPPASPTQSLGWADAVFLGTVISLGYEEAGTDTLAGGVRTRMHGGDMVRYDILVGRVWKGDIADTVTVYSEGDKGASSGFSFYLGNDYLVYARWQGAMRESARWPRGTEFPVLVTDSCMRTRDAGRADEDLEELPFPERIALERQRILIRRLSGRDTESRETVPGGEVEIALYGYLSRWLEDPPKPLPFSPSYLETLEHVVNFLEAGIADNGGVPEERLSLARAAPTGPLGLEDPIRVLDVTRVGNGGSILVVLQGRDGDRLTLILREGLKVHRR